jgi:hypothetical protein
MLNRNVSRVMHTRGVWAQRIAWGEHRWQDSVANPHELEGLSSLTWGFCTHTEDLFPHESNDVTSQHASIREGAAVVNVAAIGKVGGSHDSHYALKSGESGGVDLEQTGVRLSAPKDARI